VVEAPLAAASTSLLAAVEATPGAAGLGAAEAGLTWVLAACAVAFAAATGALLATFRVEATERPS
jgi:hypothetical protein